MSKIRIDSVPPSTIEGRPDFAGEAWVGLELHIVGEESSHDTGYSVTAQEAFNQLRAAGMTEAHNWWEQWAMKRTAFGGVFRFTFPASCCTYLP